MTITPELTDAAVLQILGERIARYRIEAGLTQVELAEGAGIGKRTLERIEAGHGAELVTLIRILRTLNILERFEGLLPDLPPSPIEQLKLRGKQRQRVSRVQRRRGVEGASLKPWTWHAPNTDGARPAKTSRSTKRKP